MAPAALLLVIAALGAGALAKFGSGDGRTGRPTAPSTGFPTTYAGTWNGLVRQDNGRTWPIRLTFAAGGRVAQVTYANLGCSGTQTLLTRGGTTLTLREDITDARGSCTDHGSVTLRLKPDGTLEFAYLATRESGDGTYTATGSLERS